MKSLLSNNREWILVFSVLIIGAFFRLYNLSSVPPSPSIDEVSLGWNAYSLLKTGRDEYGKLLPLILRAYDDYRPALYAYTIVPFISVFGLTVFSVRFPSILLSILTIFSTYILVKILFKNRIIALLASFFLAISPWHIYISRLGHEANLGLSAGIFAITVFFISITSKKHSWLIYISGVLFVIALYGYQSQKIIIPLFIFGLLICFFRELIVIKTKVIKSVIVSFLLLLPLIWITLSGEGLIRFHGTSVLNDQDPFYETVRKEFLSAKKDRNIIKQIYNYPRFTPIRIVSSQYISHFSPTWLFTGGSNEAHKVPFLGLLYSWELVFILFGFYAGYVLLERKTFVFLLIWVVISPLPAAITTQAPHAMRAYTFLPVWQIFGAAGLFSILERTKKRFLKVGLVVITTITVVYGVIQFTKNYFIVFPITQSQSFSYALAKAIPFVEKEKNGYEHIVISNILGTKDYRYPSYMFFLFHTNYDPEQYLKVGGTVSGSFDATHQFDLYQFRSIGETEQEKRTLYVNTYSEKTDGKKTQYITNYLDETPGIQIYTYE